MTTTERTITTAQIDALQFAALVAGDHATVTACDRARAGSASARRLCARIIRQAAELAEEDADA